MDGPIIVVEGADCAGKTTLARRLCVELHMDYVHVVSPKQGDDVFAHHFDPIKDVVSPTAVDRLHVSDDVYGRVVRGAPGLTEAEFGYIDGFLLARRGLVVICSPPFAAVRAGVLADPANENHTEERARLIWDEYRRGDLRTMLPILKYDYTRDPTAGGLLRDIGRWVDSGYRIKLCPTCARRFVFGGKTGRPYCAECSATYTAKRHAAGATGPSKRGPQRFSQMRYRYGIGEAAFNALGDLQGWRCAVCGCRLLVSPHVDHDHATGRVRGLLCGGCNRGIGLLKGDLSVLRKAASYVEKGGSSF